jgi:hypothetical protein
LLPSSKLTEGENYIQLGYVDGAQLNKTINVLTSVDGSISSFWKSYALLKGYETPKIMCSSQYNNYTVNRPW